MSDSRMTKALKSKGSAMSRLIENFFKSSCGVGFGFFEGDMDAVKWSRLTSVSQRKKFRRYGVVPKTFADYLIEIHAIDECDVTSRKRTIWYFMDKLHYTPNRNGPVPSKGELIRTALLKEHMPRTLMGSFDRLQRRAEAS